ATAKARPSEACLCRTPPCRRRDVPRSTAAPRCRHGRTRIAPGHHEFAAGISAAPEPRDRARHRRPGWLRSCGLLEPRIDLMAQQREIDRLSQKTNRAALDGLAPGVGIAIGGDHDHRDLGPLRAHPWQHLKPAHAGHVDIGQNQYQRGIGDVGGADQRRRRRGRKLHQETPGAQIAPELLTEQVFDVRLVINNEYVNAQLVPPVCDCAAPVRGSVIMNSVNAPGLVSTSILPPCCFTTMSWLMESPSPVPSPAGLVVKNGLNIFSFTSRGIPVPLSRIRISTLAPRLLVVALSVGSKPSSPDSFRLVAA